MGGLAEEHGASGYCRGGGHKQIAMTQQLLRRRFGRAEVGPKGGPWLLLGNLNTRGGYALDHRESTSTCSTTGIST
jgi:hypothetical protein